MKKNLILSIYDDLNNPYYGGGGPRVVHEVITRIIDQYDVTILTGRYPGAVDGVRDGITFKHIGTSRFGSKINQFFFHFYLIYYVLVMDFDIWIESFTPPFSTSCLQFFTNKPVLALVQMLSGEDMMRKYHIPFHWFERIGLGTYKYFSIPSSYLFSKIRKYNKKAKIELIPHGIDLPTDISVVNPEKKYLLFVGRIEMDQKGLDLMLEAFSKVTGFPEYKLCIAGGGNLSDEEELKKQITTLGIESRVEVLGRVQGENKDLIYRNATLVVVPSRYETFGLVALEALSYGKPVIHFDLDSLKWIPDNCAKSVKPFSVEELAATISELLSNVEERKLLSENGINFSHQFSWDKIAEIYKAYLVKISEAKFDEK